MKSSILKPLEIHECDRITQGDILRDFNFYFVTSNKEVTEISFQYIVVLSQDCDLEQGQNGIDYINLSTSNTKIKFNQLIPNILFTPAFIVDEIREGKQLENFFNISCDRFNSEKYKLIKQNKDERYHFIEGNQDMQLPDLIIDFTVYFTVSTEFFLSNFKNKYLSTVNELYRENLSQRYCNYLNRIGLPNL